MKTLRNYQDIAVKEVWAALKASDEPTLLMASVGAGKSLMIAEILRVMDKAGKRALCLVNNAELVRSNAETLKGQGVESSIYCASLGKKEHDKNIVFGMPVSVLNAIRKKDALSEIPFNLIVVDEAHAINYTNDKSAFMRILRHFKTLYPSMRVLGATGTNYRFKGSQIVGDNCLFRSQVGNVTTDKLIRDGYLVEPFFEVEQELVLDFKSLQPEKTGMFNQKKLAEALDKDSRKTKLICEQLVHVMREKKRFGCFVFATHIKHAQEILSYLPEGEAAIIIGDTPQEERERILNKARYGEIKYLVNISILTVGVDVPPFDTIAFLRPTESLVLMVQMLGRALRLAPRKKNALVLDFAGNIERHGDWDDPMINKAVKALAEEQERPIKCPACMTMNSIYARRCIGVKTYDTGNQRCEYYFSFIECPGCGVQNDKAARHCRKCSVELKDVNEKLAIMENGLQELFVNKVSYSLTGTETNFSVRALFYCTNFKGQQEMVFAMYQPCASDKSHRYFYGSFIKSVYSDLRGAFEACRSKEWVKEFIEVMPTPKKIVAVQKVSKLDFKKMIF